MSHVGENIIVMENITKPGSSMQKINLENNYKKLSISEQLIIIRRRFRFKPKYWAHYIIYFIFVHLNCLGLFFAVRINLI